MCIANVLTELRWRNTNPTILPDLGFAFANTLTPQLTANTAWRRVPDLSVNIALGVTALWLIADGPRKAKLAVLRRFLGLASLLLLGRALCVLATQLPDPFTDAMYTRAVAEWEGNVLLEALLVLFRVRATSTDVFYSGHSVMITLCALTLDTYSQRRGVVAVFVVFCVCALYVIVATRFHYSIDVEVEVEVDVVVVVGVGVLLVDELESDEEVKDELVEDVLDELDDVEVVVVMMGAGVLVSEVKGPWTINKMQQQ